MPSTLQTEGDVIIAKADDQVSTLVRNCLRWAFENRASDVHFQPNSKGMKVRMRIDGMMRDYMQLSHEHELKVASHIKAIAEIDVEKRHAPIDGRFEVDHKGKVYDLRVSAIPICGRNKSDKGLCRQRLVIRILDNTSVFVELPDLGLTGEPSVMIKQALDKRRGLVLCTGPTGSGKTTLLYVMARQVNDLKINILGIGDPPEYDIPDISQSAVTPNCGFADYVRGFLRQDPDVIMVGEIALENDTSLWQISQGLNLDFRLTAHHAEKLEKSGLIKKEHVGRAVMHFLTPCEKIFEFIKVLEQ